MRLASAMAVGDAEGLELAGAPRQPVLLVEIGKIDRIQMARGQGTKADIGPNAGRVDMHDITGVQSGPLTLPHHAREDRPDRLMRRAVLPRISVILLILALPDARQRDHCDRQAIPKLPRRGLLGQGSHWK